MRLSTESDSDQYKLLDVTENPLSEALRYNVLASLENTIHVSISSQTHSHLMNKDSRFRKDPQYIFWQKEMRELSAGVYNLMTMPMSVGNLLRQVNSSGEQLEANFSTMLQTVRGTKQYW